MNRPRPASWPVVLALVALASLGLAPCAAAASCGHFRTCDSTEEWTACTTVASVTLTGSSASASCLGSVTTILGPLRAERGVTSLAGLEAVTRVGDNVEIYSNDGLTSLAGLNALTHVGGYIDIEGNPALASFAGLESLTKVMRKFKVNRNAALASVAALEALTTVDGYLDFRFNNALVTLDGLDKLTSLGGLNIESNAKLASLAGLRAVTSLRIGLHIQDNPVLTSLAGLEAIPSVEVLIIQDNNALTSLDGLRAIARVDTDVRVFRNRALTSLAGLDALASVGRHMAVWGNPVLEHGCFCQLREWNDLEVSSNPSYSCASLKRSLLLSGGGTTSCTDSDGGKPFMVRPFAPPADLFLPPGETGQWTVRLDVAPPAPGASLTVTPEGPGLVFEPASHTWPAGSATGSEATFTVRRGSPATADDDDESVVEWRLSGPGAAAYTTCCTQRSRAVLRGLVAPSVRRLAVPRGGSATFEVRPNAAVPAGTDLTCRLSLACDGAPCPPLSLSPPSLAWSSGERAARSVRVSWADGTPASHVPVELRLDLGGSAAAVFAPAAEPLVLAPRAVIVVSGGPVGRRGGTLTVGLSDAVGWRRTLLTLSGASDGLTLTPSTLTWVAGEATPARTVDVSWSGDGLGRPNAAIVWTASGTAAPNYFVPPATTVQLDRGTTGGDVVVSDCGCSHAAASSSGRSVLLRFEAPDAGAAPDCTVRVP